MKTLVLKLCGPWQAWGTDSRFTYRNTANAPSKSGILGMLAAAQGRRRTDPIEDLVDLSFGVRVDQPGHVERDFQTARSLDGRKSMPLTTRYYLADARFVVALSGEDQVISGLAASVRSPKFPIYLGRRSCPPAEPILVGVRNATVAEVLGGDDSSILEPWIAAKWWLKKQRSRVNVSIIRDAEPTDEWHETVSDSPVSFNPEHRKYSLRPVVHTTKEFVNQWARSANTAHDPMGWW